MKDSPGYYIEERKWMSYFLEQGYVDIFRQQHVGQTDHYTWWSYRTKARTRNIGWRIDYHCVSQDFVKYVIESSISSKVMGSDHCPVMLKIQENRL